MTGNELLLASIICHLIEHIETNEPIDLAAARGLLETQNIRNLFKHLHQSALLPHPRQPIKILQEILK